MLVILIILGKQVQVTIQIRPMEIQAVLQTAHPLIIALLAQLISVPARTASLAMETMVEVDVPVSVEMGSKCQKKSVMMGTQRVVMAAVPSARLRKTIYAMEPLPLELLSATCCS